MLGDRHGESSTHSVRGAVTLATIRGELTTGRMTSFAPNAADHKLELGDRGASRLFAAEDLAWLGFHREHGAPESAVARNAPQVIRVHSFDGKAFVVRVDPAALTHPLGFFAVNADDATAYAEMWFYHHGVRARELVEPIGSIMMRKGVLSPEPLARGLEAQATSRAAPLGQILVEQQRLSPDDVEHAIELQKRSRMRIGEVLVEAGLATEEDIQAALTEQRRRHGRKLGEVLVDLGTITEADLAIALAEKFSMSFVDLDQTVIEPAAVKALPRELLEKHLMLPLAITDKTVTLAVADPLYTVGTDLARRHLKRRVVEVLATPTQLKRFVAAALGNVDKGDGEFKKILDQLAHEARASGVVGAAEVDEAHEDSAVIKLVNQVIADACRRGASDIHVEPYGEDRGVVVRFRIDGDCVVYQELPTTVRSSLVARIKVMANLDIAERRKPQDGKIRFRFHDKVVELRVATIPTVNGNEDVVMRVLASSRPLQMARLGFSERNLAAMKVAISQPHGLILCVGPTGSGKTTTLHSLLGTLNTDDVKIWTAEDPVEITQQGLRQVQVHPRIGFTFAAALRSFLRADPDIIMVGEMRDLETAGIAVEASLTGHLVLSTLHTNSAPETITRLIDMGVEPFTFGDAILGVLAQRLVRGLCAKCVEHYHPTTEEIDELERWYGGPHPKIQALRDDPGATLPRAVGCGSCGQSGYKGRVGVHEFLAVDDAVRRAIQHKANITELRALAVAGGMTTLLQDGIEKALDGRTDLHQVAAVCGKA
jgi:type II secretory ATPase GspE/PulE/Tfp pilus assembly ATPase PilB-like protein